MSAEPEGTNIQGEAPDAQRVVETAAATEAPLAALAERSPDHDAIVLGERAPSLRSLVFGDEHGRVAAASGGPVLVVRYDSTLDAGPAGEGV